MILSRNRFRSDEIQFRDRLTANLVTSHQIQHVDSTFYTAHFYTSSKLPIFIAELE